VIRTKWWRPIRKLLIPFAWLLVVVAVFAAGVGRDETPWWMRFIFGPVREEYRIPLALVVILSAISGILFAYSVPGATQVWDVVKGMVGGGIGGGLVAHGVRRR
jgi:uncharacterized integral membrane protein